jgi:hypothetical protein
MDADIATIIAVYQAAKSELAAMIAFRQRAEPLLAQLEELLAERARLKAILDSGRAVTEDDFGGAHAHRH